MNEDTIQNLGTFGYSLRLYYAVADKNAGGQRPIVLSETERRVIAFHEAGHALVAHHLPETDRVNSVTILPRGQSLGVTQFVAEEDRYNHSRERLMACLAIGLGGRETEELTFGPDRVTTGAENDFQVVTGLTRNMVKGTKKRLYIFYAAANAFLHALRVCSS